MKVSVIRQEDIDGFSVHATATEGIHQGRRLFYGWPDGKPQNGHSQRVLSDIESEYLIKAIIGNGGKIDISKPCWFEYEPLYGSEAYMIMESDLALMEDCR